MSKLANGHADIIALWVRTLQLAEGRIAPREFAAMRLLVDLTWEALANAGHDMAALKAEVKRLMQKGETDGSGAEEDCAA